MGDRGARLTSHYRNSGESKPKVGLGALKQVPCKIQRLLLKILISRPSRIELLGLYGVVSSTMFPENQTVQSVMEN